jgi:predicted metal-dependent HD superfamily phosphohydrolase
VHASGALLSALDLAYTLIQDPDAVEMALWFHDAIYIPRSSENEKESAELFVRAAGDHFRPSFIRKVYELILVTAHKELAQECNKQFVADIDLSSFGVDWEEFLRDTKAVGEEQADSSDAVFYPAHAKWMLLRTSPIRCLSDSIVTDGSEMIRCEGRRDFSMSMID